VRVGLVCAAWSAVAAATAFLLSEASWQAGESKALRLAVPTDPLIAQLHSAPANRVPRTLVAGSAELFRSTRNYSASFPHRILINWVFPCHEPQRKADYAYLCIASS
jgi:hypothetical protein